jgi:glycosyltransferase involved in cell wall biosynthesis
LRILQLVPRLPFPPDDGGKIGILGITRAFLGLGHEVRMAGFDEEGTEAAFAAELGSRLDGWFVEGIPQGRVWRAKAAVGAGIGTYLHDKYFSPSFLDRLLRDFDAWPADLVHVDHSHMGSYGLALQRERPGVRVCLRAHNVESVIWYRRAKVAPDPVRRAIFDRQGRLSERFERRLFEQFAGVLAISGVDRDLIQSQAPGARLYEMAAGYELQSPTALRASLEDAPRICFVGSLEYTANRDGLAWFVEQVWPALRARFPRATLTVAGRSSTPVTFLQGAPGVTYAGFVPRVEDVTDHADLAVVPLRIGGGMRLKILDFLSRGLPIVSTATGAEGIPTNWDSREVLLTADTPAGFVDAVAALAASHERRVAMAATGRELIAARYDWKPMVAGYLDWALSLSPGRSP